MSALVSGLARGGLALAGGLLGNRSAEKAAQKQFLRQDALDEQSDRRHRDAVNEANESQGQWFSWHLGEVRSVNDQISAHNERMMGYSGGIDFDALNRDAEASGWNPLTVAKYGLAGAYARTPGSFMSFFAPSAAPSAIAPMRGNTGQAVAANTTNAWGDAIAAGLAGFDNYDPNKRVRQALEFELSNAQIRNLNSDTARNLRFASTPSYPSTGRALSAGGFGGAARAAASQGLPSALGAVSIPAVGEVNVTNPWRLWGVDPETRDGEAFETRYAGLGDLIGGIHVASADFNYNRRNQQAANVQYLKETAEAAWRAVGGGTLGRIWSSPAWNAR